MAALAAFDFLKRPHRTIKPRKRGLSVVSDKCKSLAQAADIIQTMGDIIDHMKLPDHVGHQYASFLVNSGRTLYEIQQILGHSDPKVTQRYSHL